MLGFLGRFVKLRTKIVLGVTITYGILFGSSYTLYYHLISGRTIDNIRNDLMASAEGAAAGIDVDDLVTLYRTAERNDAGYSDHPIYQEHLNWFASIRNLNPTVYPYSFAIGPVETSRRIGDAQVMDGDLEIVYLVDSLSIYEPDDGLRFLEPDSPSGHTLEAYHTGETVHRPLYTDDWGSWMSAYVPLRDRDGEIVGILGMDIKADYIDSVHRELQKSALLSFFPTYGLTILLVYLFAGSITKKITSLTELSEKVAHGEYQKAEDIPEHPVFPDEINVLAHMFQLMSNAIQEREHNIRQHERTEAEIRLQLAQEKELSSLRSRTISTISHELRTPLTIVKMASKLMQARRGELSDDKLYGYIEQTSSASTRMSEIVDEMLFIESSDAGVLRFEPAAIDLSPFLRKLVEEMRSFDANAHTIALEMGDLPTELLLDKRLLRHIFVNLITNSLKYSPAGTTVLFRINCLENTIKFEVIDDGIGIPEEEQPHLFNRFFRAKNVDPSGGTGLGLSIVQRCVELHQGEISFTSRLNKGTTFQVLIPLAKPYHHKVATPKPD